MSQRRRNTASPRLSRAALMLALASAGLTAFKAPQGKPDAVRKWFPQYDFRGGSFGNPDPAFGPYTRWWWPGNDVTKDELAREVRQLAANGIAGVEIQPFTRGLNPAAPDAVQARVFSWDEPAFYENLRSVIDAAEKAHIAVDLNNGSGWPTGGPHIKPEDNFHNLAFSAQDIDGGRVVDLPLRRPSTAHRSLAMNGVAEKYYADVDPASGKLQVVLAVKAIPQTGEDTLATTYLDPRSVVNLSSFVSGDQLSWTAPAGTWKIISFWDFPAGEAPVLLAKREVGLVVDHFDSSKVLRNYEYLLGQRSGLVPYHGKGIRAVFNDSYEFKVNRHFTTDFFDYFQRARGYDIRPWLPANMKPGYNNFAESVMFPNDRYDFRFGPEDWRLRYDYDLTLSDLLQAHFFDGSRRWLESRGMLHRTQAYGMNMDVIQASGNASIPEAEQLFDEGSEGFIKVVSSGAHLYNRPVVSCESIVFRHRADMTTPQKIKASVDKLFVAGINQVIYHGTSYHYKTVDFGAEGWNAWDSPFTPTITFSSNITERDPFWPFMKDVNAYIRRSQYALRSGKPHTDVLIYYPYLGFEYRAPISNPEEILVNGYFEGVEPANVMPAAAATPPKKPTETTRWFQELWKTVNELEHRGVTWEFVNDESIQAATMQQGAIDIRGNRYQAIILANAPYIRQQSAERLEALSKGGAAIVAVGTLPTKQPGYRNYTAADAATSRAIRNAVSAPSTSENAAITVTALASAITEKQVVRYAGTYDFLRRIERRMADGSQLDFIWNKSDQWQTVSLHSSQPNNYWLNPETGGMHPAGNTTLQYTLPPYGSIMLLASKSVLQGATPLAAPSQSGSRVAELNSWDVRSNGKSRSAVALFDWRNDPEFKYNGEKASYRSTFDFSPAANARYVLDLGTVYYTAEVRVNGKTAGTRIFAPYQLDIGKLLKTGINTVEVVVTPVKRNEYIGYGNNKDPRYLQYENKESTLMPNGLIGPVVVRKL